MRLYQNLLFTIVALAMCVSVQAQLAVDATVNATEAVEDILLGGGVTVSNITYSGPTNQIGSFECTGCNLGLPSGIIMASGNVTEAIGPNNS